MPRAPRRTGSGAAHHGPVGVVELRRELPRRRRRGRGRGRSRGPAARPRLVEVGDLVARVVGRGAEDEEEQRPRRTPGTPPRPRAGRRARSPGRRAGVAWPPCQRSSTVQAPAAQESSSSPLRCACAARRAGGTSRPGSSARRERAAPRCSAAFRFLGRPIEASFSTLGAAPVAAADSGGPIGASNTIPMCSDPMAARVGHLRLPYSLRRRGGRGDLAARGGRRLVSSTILVRRRAGGSRGGPAGRSVPRRAASRAPRAAAAERRRPLITPGHRFAVAPGAQALGLGSFPALVDPTAVVAAAPRRISKGSVVYAACVLGAGTEVDRFVHVDRAPRSATMARSRTSRPLGPAACSRPGHDHSGGFVGAGAVCAPGVIGANAVVSTGAVVVGDVAAGDVVAATRRSPCRGRSGATEVSRRAAP